jgi:hypothetical protein
MPCCNPLLNGHMPAATPGAGTAGLPPAGIDMRRPEIAAPGAAGAAAAAAAGGRMEISLNRPVVPAAPPAGTGGSVSGEEVGIEELLSGC